MPAGFSLDVFNKYADFKPHFELIRVASENGIVISEYESKSPIKGHKYHLRVEDSAYLNKMHYSFI